jgi:hypothetical protein
MARERKLIGNQLNKKGTKAKQENLEAAIDR